MPDVDVTPYPPMLRRLVRSIGIGGTMSLLRWRGGCRLCLPRDPRKSELMRHLSFADVQALVTEFGAGMWVTLPKSDKLLMHERNTEIRDAHASGDSLATLALRYGLTTRHIMNVVANNPDDFGDAEDGSQSDLF